MRVAAIDQGTTSTRLLVVEDGVAEIRHAVRHRQHYPRPGWVEHDPLELLANVRAGVEAAGPVAALGLDNQGESCLAWDGATGEPLSPVIVWQENRTSDAIKRLRAEGAEAATLDRAGPPLDRYFSASKLHWLLREVGSRPSLRLGTTDAWFLDRLTGRFETDVTTASRTSLMNLGTCTWDEELCGLFGVPIDCLPELRPTVGDFGTVGGTPVTAAVVDQQADALRPWLPCDRRRQGHLRHRRLRAGAHWQRDRTCTRARLIAYRRMADRQRNGACRRRRRLRCRRRRRMGGKAWPVLGSGGAGCLHRAPCDRALPRLRSGAVWSRLPRIGTVAPGPCGLA